MPYLKKEKLIEVLVLLTPKQIRAIHERYPNEMSFTRQLICWSLAGKPPASFRARRLEADLDKLMVYPEEEEVPVFVIAAH